MTKDKEKDNIIKFKKEKKSGKFNEREEQILEFFKFDYIEIDQARYKCFKDYLYYFGRKDSKRIFNSLYNEYIYPEMVEKLNLCNIKNEDKHTLKVCIILEFLVKNHIYTSKYNIEPFVEESTLFGFQVNILNLEKKEERERFFIYQHVFDVFPSLRKWLKLPLWLNPLFC
jgi:hypothetical protein